MSSANSGWHRTDLETRTSIQWLIPYKIKSVIVTDGMKQLPGPAVLWGWRFFPTKWTRTLRCRKLPGSWCCSWKLDGRRTSLWRRSGRHLPPLRTLSAPDLCPRHTCSWKRYKLNYNVTGKNTHLVFNFFAALPSCVRNSFNFGKEVEYSTGRYTKIGIKYN